MAVRDIEKDRDHWKEEYERVMVENAQLRALYEELLKHTSEGIYPIDSARGHQTMVALQEQLQQEQVCVQQWRRKCEEINKELEKWKSQCVLLEIQYRSFITSFLHACTRKETRHKYSKFTSRVCVDHVSCSV